MRLDKRWNLFKCERCGKCCIEIGLPYDPKSVFEIAKFLNLSVKEVIKSYYGRIRKNHWISQDEKRTPCPFLRTDAKRKTCGIYQVRPEGCRSYPFDTDFGRQGVDCPAARIVYKKLYKCNHGEKNQNMWLKGKIIMSTHSLQLLDFPGNYKKGTLPYGPRAFIAIKTFSKVKWRDKTGNNEIDFTVISPECVSVSEFQYEVKRLIKELETLNKQADKFFRREKEKRSSMSFNKT